MSTAAGAGVMPALFVGHGSPMNAIEDTVFRRTWQDLGTKIPRPRAILCISAHWETDHTSVGAAEQPATIHDFHGFPRALFDVRYPAPGDPALARRVTELVQETRIHLDPSHGIDHGAWSVLSAMYPDADIPVLQLSLASRRPGAWHYAIGQELSALREEGVLLMGSGNIVHNLRYFKPDKPEPLDWALRFDEDLRERILEGHHEGLMGYETLGPDALLAIPTPEHYLPLLYILGAQRDEDSVELFNTEVVGGISMTSVLLGAGSA